MTRRTMALGVALALVLGTFGCASVDCGSSFSGMELTADGAAPVAHVNGSCWGVYFLPMIPLLTGDTTNPGKAVTVVSDTVRVEPVVEMVTAEAKARGATKVIDLQSHRTGLYIPPVFWFKACQASGNAVK